MVHFVTFLSSPNSICLCWKKYGETTKPGKPVAWQSSRLYKNACGYWLEALQPQKTNYCSILFSHSHARLSISIKHYCGFELAIQQLQQLSSPFLLPRPIFGAQQLMLDNGVPSQVGVPVFGKPVMIQSPVSELRKTWMKFADLKEQYAGQSVPPMLDDSAYGIQDLSHVTLV